MLYLSVAAILLLLVAVMPKKSKGCNCPSCLWYMNLHQICQDPDFHWLVQSPAEFAQEWVTAGAGHDYLINEHLTSDVLMDVLNEMDAEMTNEMIEGFMSQVGLGDPVNTNPTNFMGGGHSCPCC